eukprot:TRINITY_DN38376_c0_g1_i1.p1 TRINITY_DN38376_c0_g1~~TRINITY_DN38376_c0_g1_i1.p1  ORF type:complete len:185 (-),score=0.34 TRINITY_DN38376_c0_g1_i1:137-691(-)
MALVDDPLCHAPWRNQFHPSILPGCRYCPTSTDTATSRAHKVLCPYETRLVVLVLFLHKILRNLGIGSLQRTALAPPLPLHHNKGFWNTDDILVRTSARLQRPSLSLKLLFRTRNPNVFQLTRSRVTFFTERQGVLGIQQWFPTSLLAFTKGHQIPYPALLAFAHDEHSFTIVIRWYEQEYEVE